VSPNNSFKPTPLRGAAWLRHQALGSGKVKIRRELPFDTAAIEAVTIAAFLDAEHTGHTEQHIVRDLRRAGQLTVSLVAEDDGTIVGHVAVSPVSVSSGAEHWYGLGPISVSPARQSRGIGAMLMQRALADLRELGAAGCVVLGDPRYYSRFGFVAIPSLELPGVPAQYFQAISFIGSMPCGQVAYHDAFAARA